MSKETNNRRDFIRRTMYGSIGFSAIGSYGMNVLHMSKVKNHFPDKVGDSKSFFAQISIPEFHEDYFRTVLKKTGENHETVVITSNKSIALDDTLFSSNQNIMVRADRVFVAKKLNAPGRKIQVFARSIVFEKNSEIDVSGIDGEPHAVKTAPSGKNAGEHGKSGAEGNAGSNSGDVYLFAKSIKGTVKVLANGGNGEKGQNGGTGAPGKIGVSGVFGDCRRINAEDGGNGGDAGPGGKAGAGGNGGNVRIESIEQLDNRKINISVKKGIAGEISKSGNPGAKGAGGKAGGCQTSYPTGTEFGPIVDDHTGRTGVDGKAGNPAGIPEGNDHGKDGTIIIQNKEINDSNKSKTFFFAKQLTLLYGKLIIREAFINHLNGNLELVTKQLLWLQLLLKPEVTRSIDTGLIIDYPDEDNTHLNSSHVLDDSYNSLRIQVAIQIKRLLYGLDAFGNSYNYVSSLQYNQYDTFIERWINSAKETEELHEDYFQKARAQKLKLFKVRDLTESSAKAIGNLKLQIDISEKRREELDQEILKMVPTLILAANSLVIAAGNFEQEIRKRSNGCDIGDLIVAAGSIIAIANGAGEVVAAIGPTMGAIQQLDSNIASEDKSIFENLKGYSKQFEPVRDEFGKLSGGLSKTADAYNKLKGVLKKEEVPNIPSDEAKILVDREEIMKTIDRFKDIPGAEEYRQAVDNYTELALTRNSQIFEHDAIILGIEDTKAKIGQLEHDLEKLKQKTVNEYDSNLSEIRDLVEQSMDLHKSELVKAIYSAQRAIAYSTLKYPSPYIGRSKVQELVTTWLNTDTVALIGLENAGREPIVRDFGENTPIFSLLKLTGKVGIEELRKGNEVVFSIPESAFGRRSMLFVTTAKVDFKGVESPGQIALELELTHLGQAKLNDKDGKVHIFTHQSRKTDLIDGLHKGTRLGGSDAFIDMTPFGPWKAKVKNQIIDLQDLEDISIEFAYQYLPT